MTPIRKKEYNETINKMKANLEALKLIDEFEINKESSLSEARRR